MNSIFKKRSIERISSPEKLDDYIRVTTPSVLLTLVALLLLLAGAILWGIFGELTIHNPDGSTEIIAPIRFIIM